MEARGTARGGRFVTGFAGEQYALPEAIDQLRAVRRAERTGETVHVSATDPLNLVGIITPGPRIPSVRTNTVTYVDGLPAPAADGGPRADRGPLADGGPAADPAGPGPARRPEPVGTGPRPVGAG